MAEWLIEEGIGEHRAALVEHGEILAARIEWPGALAAGEVAEARLISRTAGSSRGTARFMSGEEALVDGLPRDASEGAIMRLEVTRAAIRERHRTKLAQARPSTAALRAAPSLAKALGGRIVRRIDGWDELYIEAMQQSVEFSGGSLLVEPATALTAIDIDGTLPAGELCICAVPAIARAIRRFDLSGSIVIDFPTLNDKNDRKAIDAALAKALNDWPHERTAMNGFGLVHIVARRERASLIERLTSQNEAAARLLLRRAEQVDAPGALLLCAPTRVREAMHADWETELTRRTGRQIRWQANDTLAPWGCFAQAVPL